MAFLGVTMAAATLLLALALELTKLLSPAGLGLNGSLQALLCSPGKKESHNPSQTTWRLTPCHTCSQGGGGVFPWGAVPQSIPVNLLPFCPFHFSLEISFSIIRLSPSPSAVLSLL